MQLDETADEEVGRAKELWRSGRTDEALAALRAIVAAHPRSALAHLAAGEILWDSGELELARTHFKEATRLVPHSEAASLALFHIRLRLGDEDGAFREMRRFLATSESFEYRRLVAEFRKIPPDVE